MAKKRKLRKKRSTQSRKKVTRPKTRTKKKSTRSRKRPSFRPRPTKKKAAPKGRRFRLGFGASLLKRPQKLEVDASLKNPDVGLAVGVAEAAGIKVKLRLRKMRLKKKKKREQLPSEVSTSQSLSLIPEQVEPISLVQVPEPVAIPVPVAPPVQMPLPFQAAPQGGLSVLSTEDILRPSDLLRQSIEGFLADQRSPHTRRAYGKDLKRFVKFLHLRNLNQGVESLNRTILIAYKEFLLSEKLEHTTVDRHIATLRSFFKWLVDDGHLVKSPAEGVRFLNPKRLSTTLGFSDEEVRRVLTCPDLHTRTGSLHYAVLMVLFYCGLRRSEVCDLQISNIGVEREQRVLRLRGKGNAERIIVMIPPVWSALKHYFHIANRDFQENGYLFVPIRNNRTGVLKKPLDTSMIFYIVTKYSRMAGIANRVSPHSCRATAISNARDHDVPDRAIQEFAGWASPDMITRYDKRKNAVENSAAYSISYGSENRPVPEHSDTEVPTS